MKTFPLRYTIALTYITLVLITSVLVFSLTYQSGQHDIQSMALKLHTQTYSRVESQMNNFFSIPQNINQINVSYIQSDIIDPGDITMFKKHLLSQFLNYPLINSIEFADEKRNDIGPARNLFDVPLSFGQAGKQTGYVYRLQEIDPKGVTGKILYEQADYDPREKSWYQEAVTADRPTWTPIYLWPNGDVGLDAVTPVKTGGKLIGVLDTAITLRSVGDYLKTIKFTPNSQIYIIEKNGLLVAGTDVPISTTVSNNELERITIDESDAEDLQIISEYLKANQLELKDISTEKQLVVSNKMRHFVTVSPYTDRYGLDWLVIMSTPESDVMSNLNSNIRITIIIISLAVIFSVIFALILAWWIISPVSKLSAHAKSLSEGNWEQRIDVTRTDEIGGLVEAFQKMAAQLKQNNASLNSYAATVSRDNQKLEAILKSMADAVCVVDIDQNIVLSNNSFSKMTGLTKAELNSLSLSEFVRRSIPKSEDKSKLSDVSDMLFGNSGGVVYFESIELKTKSQKNIIVSGVGSRLRDETDKVIGIVLVLRDVTRQVEFEKMKESFVALASHQLRTPLTGIKWSVGILLKNKSLPTNILSLVKQIAISGDKMISLVNGLLSVSKIESDKVEEVRKEKILLKDILKQAYTGQKGVYKDKDIRLIGLDKISNTVKINGDREQLVQMFDNLLNNAAIYGNKKSTVIVGLVVDKKSVRVSVTDHGLGIPKDQQGSVFDKFYRASNVANKIPGTGLGLYYVRQVVESHGGKVWFKSEENKETTFTVELPIL